MQFLKKVLFISTLLWLAAVPLSAEALSIQICSPTCLIDTAPFTTRSDPQTTFQDANGVWTTRVPISMTFRQFTISATVTSQQSGTLQKIAFNPTVITAITGSGCSITSPCSLEIVATSDEVDFPVAKPVGGYPAGATMIGSFTGPQGVNPNGDSISVTAEASGVRLGAIDPNTGRPILEPLNTDVINATPGTGPGNTGSTLPSSCTGTVGCKYIAGTFTKGFSTSLTDTVQQVCDLGVDFCLTRLRTKLNVDIKTAGNKVSLPLDYTTTNPEPDPTKPPVNPTVVLVTQAVPPIATLDVQRLAVGRNNFALAATFSASSGGSVDPATEDVYLRVGDYQVTILAGSFKNLQKGKLYRFVGKIDDREVIATFTRDSVSSQNWVFIVGVTTIQLTGLPQPPLQVQVDIGVGSDMGHDLVTATFFGNGAGI